MPRIADMMSLRVVEVGPDESVSLAIARMLEENVGSVVVVEGERLVGIFTERDVLRLAGEGDQFGGVRVGDVMTRTVVTVSPEDLVVDAARLMGERRIRHLPVVDGGTVMGMISIRDIMDDLLADREETIAQLESYIHS
jgi:CBS domain-containing protein